MGNQRARIAILSELLSFPTIRGKDWTSDLSGSGAKNGDLVSLECGPASKWYLSWVIDIKRVPGGFDQFLLESVEGGELCWWHNVGLNVYSRERVAASPSWRWTDKQFEFSDRWRRVCQRNDAYVVLPCGPSFEGNSVTLNVRIRFGLCEFQHPKTFDNWKKTLSRDMDAYYKEAVSAYEGQRETAK